MLNNLKYSYENIFLVGGGVFLLVNGGIDINNITTQVGVLLLLLGIYSIYIMNRESVHVDEEIQQLNNLIENSLVRRKGFFKVYINNIDEVMEGELFEDVDYYSIKLINKNLFIILYKKYKNFIVDKNNNLVVIFKINRVNDVELNNSIEEEDINNMWLRRYKYKYILNDISKTKEAIELYRQRELFEI